MQEGQDFSLRQLFPDYRPVGSVDEIYTVPELNFPAQGVALADGTRRPYVYFNMVSSVDGRGVSAAGNAEGLGTANDRRLMHRLRLAADAVLVGAATFRRDQVMPTFSPDLASERRQYFPNDPQPWGVVLSRDGNLPLDKKFFESGPERRLVALGQAASAEREAAFRQVAQVVRVPDNEEGRPDSGWLMAFLQRELGINRLLCEGGANLNYDLITKGLADELFWTLAPKLVAGSHNEAVVTGPIFPLDGMPALSLRSIYEQEAELFLRYKIG